VAQAFPHLLSPVRIGSLELRNRIAMAPMGVEIIDADGVLRERVIQYYEARARGGAGLVISEVAAVAYPRGATTAHQIAISDDRYLPGLSELARRVHLHGAKLALQLVHHGKVARLDLKEGRELLMPSEPRWHGALDMARDLTREELGEIIAASGGAPPKIHVATHDDLRWLAAQFGEAALRARRAGVDAVELHAGHGYILSEFLSPAWNLRDDAYGGPIENRARLLQEVIRACKQRAGADFPVWCRLDAVELRTPNGIRLEDAERAAELAEAAGADAIHVSAYADATSGPAFLEAPLVHREAGFVAYAEAIKQRVRVPVIAVGRIEFELAERLVAEGRADVVAMARKHLADAELARKLGEGRPEDVRPCIYCYTCVAQAFFDRRVRCAVNPSTANEVDVAEAARTQASTPRRVLVVGGGPAGLEAARVAAQRGHAVTLCEQGDALGGALRLAARTYEPNGRIARWLEAQVQRCGVDVRLGTRVTPALARELAPDVVLVATGARRARPELPGAEQAHVFGGDDLARLLRSEDPPVGKRIAIVGAALAGVSLADYLSARGREVHLLDEGPTLGAAMAHPRRWRALAELRERGVALAANARVQAIGAQSLHASVQEGGAVRELEIPADAVIWLSGWTGDASLADALRAAGLPQVEVIGDAGRVGYIEGAIHAAFRAALAL
jgi:2,4-dienoyl-CoA reductase (NADPH2)